MEPATHHMRQPVRSRAGELDVDRLDAGTAVQAFLIEEIELPVRAPHRHGYHELIWVRAGAGEHLIDDDVVPVEPCTVTVIGRGQVHQFRHAEGLRGGVLRFNEEVLHGGTERIPAGWLLSGSCGRTLRVPEGQGERIEWLLRALIAEEARPGDQFSADVERHLISTFLLWMERWYEAALGGAGTASDPDMQLLRRFTLQLEADFAAHHDAAHYAAALAVPGPALARTLTELTGRSTKEHVTERVMLEAKRLLRYTDLTVGEIAHRVGFADQLYFSRAFKRNAGRAPQAYRDEVRGALAGGRQRKSIGVPA